jgi:hypothetical protein
VSGCQQGRNLVSFVWAQLGIGHAHLSDWLVKKDSILSFLSLPVYKLRTSYLNPPQGKFIEFYEYVLN